MGKENNQEEEKCQNGAEEAEFWQRRTSQKIKQEKKSDAIETVKKPMEKSNTGEENLQNTTWQGSCRERGMEICPEVHASSRRAQISSKRMVLHQSSALWLFRWAMFQLSGCVVSPSSSNPTPAVVEDARTSPERKNGKEQHRVWLQSPNQTLPVLGYFSYIWKFTSSGRWITKGRENNTVIKVGKDL